MIPLIEREIVKRQWMTKEDFMQMFAITQSLPGVFAEYIKDNGYKVKKKRSNPKAHGAFKPSRK